MPMPFMSGRGVDGKASQQAAGGWRMPGQPPVRLTLREAAVCALACLAAIWLTGLLARQYGGSGAPVLAASMGASAVILFVIPGSPLAQPWPFVGGQLVSALLGCIMAASWPDPVVAAALAVGLSVLAMLPLRCLHPPGAATALAPVLQGGYGRPPDFVFLWLPVGVDVVLMLALAVAINRWLLRRDYPAPPVPARNDGGAAGRKSALAGVSLAEIDQAAAGYSHFVDVGSEELSELLGRLQALVFRNAVGAATCGSIMQRDSAAVEYDTEVETAWALLCARNLHAMPVLDRKRRVIGIVTRHDFLKHVVPTPYRGLYGRVQAFIKGGRAPVAEKPEAVGHIMTRRVATLPASAHIAELLPLLTEAGHRQAPIVDADGRFAGMVCQRRLLGALYRQLAAPHGRPDAADFTTTN